MTADLQKKIENLKTLLTGMQRVAVFFSGGVDSTLLSRIAVDVLGRKNVIGLLADTPSMPRNEIAEAHKTASLVGLDLVEVMTCEIDDPVYISNPVDRCYHCKKIIFGTLVAEAQERGFEMFLDGNNIDDADDYRPGHKAAVELGVKSPLMDAGLTKQDIRDISRDLGLPTADKPALACLATRIPVGCEITRDLLMKIEKAEKVLRDAGFSQVRVRDRGDCATIEIEENDFCRFSDSALREDIVNDITAVGYKVIVLNLNPLVRK